MPRRCNSEYNCVGLVKRIPVTPKATAASMFSCASSTKNVPFRSVPSLSRVSRYILGSGLCMPTSLEKIIGPKCLNKFIDLRKSAWALTEFDRTANLRPVDFNFAIIAKTSSFF